MKETTAAKLQLLQDEIAHLKAQLSDADVSQTTRKADRREKIKEATELGASAAAIAGGVTSFVGQKKAGKAAKMTVILGSIGLGIIGGGVGSQVIIGNKLVDAIEQRAEEKPAEPEKEVSVFLR